MGTLFYGDSRHSIGIDDRSLVHLQVVMVAKLRRGESFTFTWHKGGPQEEPRASIWLHPAIPLHFDYDDASLPGLNRSWIERLTVAANSNAGLALLPEPEQQAQG